MGAAHQALPRTRHPSPPWGASADLCPSTASCCMAFHSSMASRRSSSLLLPSWDRALRPTSTDQTTCSRSSSARAADNRGDFHRTAQAAARRARSPATGGFPGCWHQDCSPRHGGALLFAALLTAPGQSDTLTNRLNQPVSAWEKSCNNFQLHTNIYSQVINSCKMLTDPPLQQC